MEAKTERMSGRRQVHTYAYLYSSARWALEQTEGIVDGSMYSSMHAILACVHCMEAYLNHLGDGVIPGWDTPGVRTPKEKFKAIRQHLGLEHSKLQGPYNQYIRALSFRDSLVHGRTHRLQGEWTAGVNPRDGMKKAMRVEWEDFACTKQAERTLEATTELLEILGVAAGDSKLHYHRMGGGQYSGPLA